MWSSDAFEEDGVQITRYVLCAAAQHIAKVGVY